MPAVRERLADERGFTLVIVMSVLAVLLGLSAAAYGVAQGDLRLTKRNTDSKAAYAAAEAGLSDFVSHLNADPAYWTRCDGPVGITQPRARGVESTEWVGVGGGAGQQYTLELLPATGNVCNPADPGGTLIASDGTFRVRATGRASATSAARRSIVATFRRTGFLDFIYWTDNEALDPVIFSRLYSCADGNPCYTTGNATNTTPSLAQWADVQCNTYWRSGRGSATYPGQINTGSGWQSYTSWLSSTYGINGGLRCGEINFVTNDDVNGPLHSNDGLLICGTPAFGRVGRNDRIEVEATLTPDQQPWRPGTCQNNQPNFRGVWSPGSRHMEPPPSNAGLRSVAWRTFTGGTRIVLGQPSATQMQVTNNGVTQTLTQPADAVIYVADASCTTAYDALNPVVATGATGEGCGDVAVSGTYAENITIAADNDIVITDDLRMLGGSDRMLGLIADNFVRVAHPSTVGSGSRSRPWPPCTNSDTSVNDLVIDAAIFALNHSFVVDRYGCGGGLGTLHVNGAIAQKHRGAVGTGSGTTGFIKGYTYDDRLRYRSPPKFLNPVDASWRIARQLEQSTG